MNSCIVILQHNWFVQIGHGKNNVHNLVSGNKFKSVLILCGLYYVPYFSNVRVFTRDVGKKSQINVSVYGSVWKCGTTSKILSCDWSVCLGLRGVIGRVAN